MNAKKLSKIMKEIEETGLLVDYLMAKGLDFDALCGCFHTECSDCSYNDHQFFSEKRVRESKEWNNTNRYQSDY